VMELDGVDLTDPDALVPCEMYGWIVQRAQQERFTPNLALRIARNIPLGAYPLLDYLVSTADSVGAAAQQLSRYFRLVNSPIAFEVRELDDPHRVIVSGGDSFFAQFTVSLIVFRIRSETGSRFAPLRVHFSDRPDDPQEFEDAFRCAIECGSTWNGISMSSDAWSLPLTRRDPILHALLQRQADGLVAPEPLDDRLASRVRAVLDAEVAREADIRIDVIARRLAMSARTLQRRLAGEGVSFQSVLDDWRKAAAGQHIAASRLAIGEVAYLLGYSEPAAFHRAFKRWYGLTPQAYRRRPSV
jgi:AraC-like DNA-binding protein